MLGEFLILFVVFVATAIIYLLSYARKNYGELEKLGIPVVKPHFFLGSSPNFYKIQNHLLDLEWFRTYGEVFGSYEGRTPTVFVCNPDVVRQIMIKDFDHFRNHTFHDFKVDETHVVSQMMDFLNDETWKTVRSIMSPTFTSAKLKRMSSIMKDVSEEFVKETHEDLKKSNSGVLANVNLYDHVFAMMMDVAARVTLNIKIDNPKDPNNEFFQALRQLFDTKMPSWVVPFTRSFPFLRTYFGAAQMNNFNYFSIIFRKVMSERKKSGQRQDDFIDFLNDFRDRTETDPEMKKLGITEATVIGNAVEFFIASQDAISTALSMLCYYLTENPEIEKKLYAEIDAYTKKYNGKVDHATFGDLTYLSACLSEALRMNPSFTRPDRLCNKDWEFNGLRIKKGMTVVVPLWAYHRNPKCFADPEKFDPERFMPYNKDKLNPIAFGTFGHGPRMCIGMRFALESLTTLSVHIFQNFQFKARPDTEVTHVPGVAFAALMGPIKLDLIQRNVST